MSNRVAVIALGAVLTGLLVGVVIAGGGDDGDSGSVDTTAPELTVPGGSAGGASGDTSARERTDRGTTGDSDAAAPDESATPAPSGPDTGGAAPAQPQDTPQNDTAPPAGSPADRFEDFCEQNPGAC